MVGQSWDFPKETKGCQANAKLIAHPHVDTTGRIAVVHNGVIENSEELKAELKKEGFVCVSETDTEVIAQLIGFLVVKKGLGLVDAVEQAQRQLKGSWGIAVLDSANPDSIVAAAHGSPLLIGIAADKKFIASEASAFAKYTRQYIALKDREVVKISVGGTMAVERHETYANNEEVALSPDPFAHWTLKGVIGGLCFVVVFCSSRKQKFTSSLLPSCER